jgi:hypothetical protein
MDAKVLDSLKSEGMMITDVSPEERSQPSLPLSPEFPPLSVLSSTIRVTLRFQGEYSVSVLRGSVETPRLQAKKGSAKCLPGVPAKLALEWVYRE